MANSFSSSKKLALFHALARQQGLGNAQDLPADLQRCQGPALLSFAQEGLWLLHQLNPGDPAYNEHFAVRILGRVDEQVLERSVNHIVARHEVLRSEFKATDGIVQTSASDLFIPLLIEDLRQADKSDKLSIAMERAAVEASLPFDLTHGPLLRTSIYRIADDESLLLLVVHHIVIDGWSLGILLQEVAAAYEAYSRGVPPALPDLPVQYSDFARWQRERYDEAQEASELEYWTRQLAGAPSTNFALRKSTAPQANSAGRQTVKIETELVLETRKTAQQSGATVFMVWLAAFTAFLWRYTGQGDIVTGSAVSVRPYPALEKLIGIFINTVALRVRLDANTTFQELLARVRVTCMDAFAHQNVRFERVVQTVNPGHDRGGSPLFQTMFVFQEAPSLSFAGLDARLVDIHNGSAKFDLSVSIRQAGNVSELSFEYRRAIFDDGAIKSMAHHLLILFRGALQAVETRISDLPLLSPSEREQVLVEWKGRAARYPEKSVHQLVEEQVERTPDAVALEHEGRKLSYRELNRQANRLGQYLRKRGVRPEVRVGICMERGEGMVAAMLGVLKAGGAYVPLDPHYPEERLQFMVEDAEAGLVLTERKLEGILRGIEKEKVCVDERWEEIGQENGRNLGVGVEGQNLAYVIYTSGSTGKPKGVGIVHQGASVLMHWAREVYGEEALWGVLASTSICFDLSVFEIFVPLCWGGKVVMAGDALGLEQRRVAEEVSLINTVPSAMAELVRMKAVPESVRVVNLAGEALPTRLVKEIYGLGTVRSVFNLYGPSEDTTYSTYGEMGKAAEGKTVDIGKPIAGTQAYVLDGGMGLVPVGVAGELWLGGEGLGRGYLKRPEMTGERFVPNPFGERGGERLYRTGDEVRWTGEGKLEFIGRKDEQVKLRGYRIELGEIEAVLREQKGVRDAVVVVGGEESERRLVAYVVREQGVEGEGEKRGEWREGLKQRLPQYMMPTEWMELEKIPMTATGKVDRKALPHPDRRRPLERKYVAARTPVEETLVTIWADVLKIDHPGIRDSFFELGGHSLLATQLISRVQKAFHVTLPVRQLFEQPTIENMSQYIATAALDDEAPNLVPVAREAYSVGF
ncbi:MAG TPA: amino acid adenylation domain-containing protein [Candidatus Angelobacter sp.]|jgi:amino acid adenylation domain-containing protein